MANEDILKGFDVVEPKYTNEDILKGFDVVEPDPSFEQDERPAEYWDKKVTEQKQREKEMEYPEFVESEFGQGFSKGTLQASLGTLMTSDPKARKDIFQSAYPDAKFIMRDDYTVMSLDGKSVIIDKPGLSRQDVSDLAADIITFLPVGRATALGKTLLAKMGLSMTATGLTDVTRQAGSKVLGSKQDIDLSRSGKVALTGVVGPLGSKLKSSVAGKLASRKATKVAASKAGLPSAAQIKEGEKILEYTGMGPLPAQLSKDPVRLAQQKTVVSTTEKTRKEAMATFTKHDIQAKGSVDRLLGKLETTPGRLKRATDSPRKLRELSTDVFRKGLSPKEIMKRKKVISAKNPEVWKDIYKYEVVRRIDKLKGKLVEAGPAKLESALFGDRAARKALYAGAPKETLKTLRYMEKGFDRIKRGRPTLPIKPIAKKGFFEGVLESMTSPMEVAYTFLSPKYAIARKGAQLGAKQLSKRKGEAMFKVLYDSKYAGPMKEIRKLGHGRKAAQAFGKLFIKAFKETGKAAGRAEAQGE
ncbi:MAG: hypothetical protein GY799_15175 [Desulfobulbaceae bacterium]|nr:hypothetical protein [Desulfobulbaceae bacterium]